MSKEVVPFHRRSKYQAGSFGQVSLKGDLLLVEFRYSPERVQAMKAIPQARFHPETKGWTVPVRHYEALRASSFFNPEVLTYLFQEEGLQVSAEERANREKTAREHLQQNPFCVQEADIEVLELDLVVRGHVRSNSLRVFPRFRSQAQKLVEKLPGAHYIRNEKSYYLPTQSLNGLLKKLRDLGLTFAVNAETSAQLSQSARLRAELLEHAESATRDELLEAMLYPIVDTFESEDGETQFCFIAASLQQRKDYLADFGKAPERRALMQTFSEEILLRLLNRAKGIPTQLWLTKNVRSFLDRRRSAYEESLAKPGESFSESILGVVVPELCWIAEPSGEAGLLVNSSAYQSYFDKLSGNPLRRQPKTLHQKYVESYFFSVLPVRLLEFYVKIKSFLKDTSGKEAPEGEAFTLLLEEARRREALRKRTMEFQTRLDAPLDGSGFSDPNLAEKLFPHQRVAVQFLENTPRAFLGDDMGLGKTLSVLTYAELLRSQEVTDFLLVICPNSLTRNWLREATHWLPKLKLSLLPSEKAEKLQFFKKLGWGGVSVDGLVVNYEAVRLEYVYPALRTLLESRRAILCLDESQRVKNSNSKTFQAIAELAPFCKRRVLLSGTPTPKDITDIWAQLKLLDDGERLGTNFYDWLGKVAELGNKYSDFAVKRFRPEWVEETVSRTHELLLRRKKEDVVNLPEKTFIVRDVELIGDQLKRYEEVRKELLLRMSSVSGKVFVREINNILEEYLRAVQLASNPRLVDDQWTGEPAKFLELDVLLEEIVKEREEKVVVWTNYLGNVNELVARYKDYGARPFSGEVTPAARDKILQEFQQGGDVKVLVAVPAAGGVGITLTAAQTAIYVDKTWNAEHWLQSIDRIHRIGQKGTVRIISLHATPVDELIARNLRRKGREQAELLGDNGEQILSAQDIYAEGEVYGLPSRNELLEAIKKYPS